MVRGSNAKGIAQRGSRVDVFRLSSLLPLQKSSLHWKPSLLFWFLAVILKKVRVTRSYFRILVSLCCMKFAPGCLSAPFRINFFIKSMLASVTCLKFQVHIVMFISSFFFLFPYWNLFFQSNPTLENPIWSVKISTVYWTKFGKKPINFHFVQHNTWMYTQLSNSQEEKNSWEGLPYAMIPIWVSCWWW